MGSWCQTAPRAANNHQLDKRHCVTASRHQHRWEGQLTGEPPRGPVALCSRNVWPQSPGGAQRPREAKEVIRGWGRWNPWGEAAA